MGPSPSSFGLLRGRRVPTTRFAFGAKRANEQPSQSSAESSATSLALLARAEESKELFMVYDRSCIVMTTNAL